MTDHPQPTLSDVSGGAWMLQHFAATMPRPQAAEFAGSLARWANNLISDGASPQAPVVAWYVPGRIELFGKHTDYCGGRSLLATVDRGFRMLAVQRHDYLIRASAAATGDTAEFPLDPSLEVSAQGWRNYIMTAARRLALNFADADPAGRPLAGADMAFVSDLPPAAGMSSSSALLISAFMALATINQLPQSPRWRENIPSPTDLATYLATVENGHSFSQLAGDRGVGTFGGSEDHVAIMCCRRNHLSQYSFAPTLHEGDIHWPQDLMLVIASSGVVADKTGSRLADYNHLAEQHARMVELFNATRGARCNNLRCCLDELEADSPPLQHVFAHLVSFRRELASWDFPGRAMQFAEEHAHIIPAAAKAIEADDHDRLGHLADRSHELADLCLRNQLPQTNALQRLARRLGAVASSAFGAGFGGSVWAVVRRRQADDFLQHWQTAYARAFGPDARRASFFITTPGEAARQIDLPPPT